MEKLKIAGGYPLKGTIRVSGAKNSAVALIPATILANSPVTIEGLPDVSDVQMLKELMEEIITIIVFDEDDFYASTKWKSEEITCFLLLDGRDAWEI